MISAGMILVSPLKNPQWQNPTLDAEVIKP